MVSSTTIQNKLSTNLQSQRADLPLAYIYISSSFLGHTARVFHQVPRLSAPIISIVVSAAGRRARQWSWKEDLRNQMDHAILIRDIIRPNYGLRGAVVMVTSLLRWTTLRELPVSSVGRLYWWVVSKLLESVKLKTTYCPDCPSETPY